MHFFLSFFFFLFRAAPWPMEVPRLRVKSKLQLPAYATAADTGMTDLSLVCDLHHSSQPCKILNPLSRAKDQTRIIMDTSWVCYCWAIMGATYFFSFLGSVAFLYSNNETKTKTNKKRNFLVAQWVKDPAWPLLWQLFDPWPRNFHMPQTRPLFFFFSSSKEQLEKLNNIPIYDNIKKNKMLGNKPT